MKNKKLIKICIVGLTITSLVRTSAFGSELFAWCSAHILQTNSDCASLGTPGSVGGGCKTVGAPCSAYVTDTSHCVTGPWVCTDSDCQYPPVTINNQFCRDEIDDGGLQGYYMVCDCEP